MPAVCNAVRRVILTAGRSAKIGTAHRSHRGTLGHLERAIAGGKILRSTTVPSGDENSVLSRKGFGPRTCDNTLDDGVGAEESEPDYEDDFFGDDDF